MTHQTENLIRDTFLHCLLQNNPERHCTYSHCLCSRGKAVLPRIVQPHTSDPCQPQILNVLYVKAEISHWPDMEMHRWKNNWSPNIAFSAFLVLVIWPGDHQVCLRIVHLHSTARVKISQRRTLHQWPTVAKQSCTAVNLQFASQLVKIVEGAANFAFQADTVHPHSLANWPDRLRILELSRPGKNLNHCIAMS